MVIPKIIIQTSRKENPQEYVVEMIRNRSANWQYFHFNDRQVIPLFS